MTLPANADEYLQFVSDTELRAWFACFVQSCNYSYSVALARAPVNGMHAVFYDGQNRPVACATLAHSGPSERTAYQIKEVIEQEATGYLGFDLMFASGINDLLLDNGRCYLRIYVEPQGVIHVHVGAEPLPVPVLPVAV